MGQRAKIVDRPRRQKLSNLFLTPTASATDLCCAALRMYFAFTSETDISRRCGAKLEQPLSFGYPSNGTLHQINIHCELTRRTRDSLSASQGTGTSPSIPCALPLLCSFRARDRRDFCKGAGERPASGVSPLQVRVIYRQRPLNNCAAEFNCSDRSSLKNHSSDMAAASDTSAAVFDGTSQRSAYTFTENAVSHSFAMMHTE